MNFVHDTHDKYLISIDNIANDLITHNTGLGCDIIRVPLYVRARTGLDLVSVNG